MTSPLKLTSKTIFELILLNTLQTHSSCSFDEIKKKLAIVEFPAPKGSLYSLLSKLSHEKIIVASPEEMDNGSMRKCYSLTQKGDDRLNNLRSLWHTIDKSIYKSQKK